MENLVKRNLDVYYFMRYSIHEFPGISLPDLRQLTYDEFGYDRFAKKTYEVQILARLASNAEKKRDWTASTEMDAGTDLPVKNAETKCTGSTITRKPTYS